MLALFAAATISLSPAVIQLRGDPGQSTTQELVMTNSTPAEMTFELFAQDVVTRGGKRVFVDAGELPGSIAATAVFSQRSVTVPAGGARPVSVTLTLPSAQSPRAVIAQFRTRLATPPGKTQAYASLATLFTFSLSDRLSLQAEDLAVSPQSASSNAAFEEAFVNDGPEPVVPRGMAVVLDARGAVVAKAPFEPRRLLPGERLRVRSEFPGELPRGSYRVLATFEYGGRALTRTAAMVVR